MFVASVVVALTMVMSVFSDNCKCIFLAGTPQAKKLAALNYVCANMDCSPINPGGVDYQPDTIESHSSWAIAVCKIQLSQLTNIKAWFQAHRDMPGVSCDFGGTAEIICEDCECLLKPNVTTAEMKNDLAYVCGNMNCSAIQPGGDHYQPNTLEDHTAWAVATWYNVHNWTYEGCQFGNSTILRPTACLGY